MTVDDRLRAAHARIPGPSEAAVAHARDRLTATMATAAADPVIGDVGGRLARPLPGDTAHRRLAVRPRTALAARRRPRLRLALPLLALALAAAAVVAIVAPRGGNVPVVRPAAPTATATPAVVDPARVLAAGRVYYQRNTFHLSTKYIGADGRPTASPAKAAYAISRSEPEEQWLAPDGSGRVVYGADSAPYLPSPEDERAWRAAGSPDLETLMGPPGKWGPKRTTYGPGKFDASLQPEGLATFLHNRDPLSVLPPRPRELSALLSAVVARQRPNGPASLVRAQFVSDALAFWRHPRAPSDLRAALREAVSTLPGVKALGELRDAAGRPAQAILLPAGGETLVIAYDPATSRLLAEGGKLDGGGVRWRMTYAVSAAAVAAVGDRP